MTTLNDHERRITTLEGRVGEIESCHGETIYPMRRRLVANELGIASLLDHFRLPPITDEQVDAVLDSE